MSVTTAKVVGPADGKAGFLGSIGVRFMLDGAEVGDRFSLGNYVQFSSIRAFKGLESPVVILCELEDLDQATYAQQLRWVVAGEEPLRDRCAAGRVAVITGGSASRT